MAEIVAIMAHIGLCSTTAKVHCCGSPFYIIIIIFFFQGRIFFLWLSDDGRNFFYSGDNAFSMSIESIRILFIDFWRS